MAGNGTDGGSKVLLWDSELFYRLPSYLMLRIQARQVRVLMEDLTPVPKNSMKFGRRNPRGDVDAKT